MKAIVQTVYGSPDVLQLAEVSLPSVPDNGVLVKVHATSVNAGDWHLMRGSPFLVRLMFGGLRKPKIATLGMDVAGTVEAVGRSVRQFKPGDAVFGDTSEAGFGGFAEYVCAPESIFVHKPDNLSFEAAASVPVAALTALQALRDCGQIQPGQTVLINGASGGVGSFAVQLAKYFGAEVHAVCSTEKMAMLQRLNPYRIIDYSQIDVTKVAAQYDLILDAAAFRSLYDYFPILKPQGTYVVIGGSIAKLFYAMLLGPVISRLRPYTIKTVTAKPNQSDLLILRDLLAAGKIQPVVDRTYPLSKVPIAIHQLEQRQVVGKIAILVEQ
jgi:NADPH:quinone reductase-like Zn-dependent oxidoreductase